jgi:hypothetical protein
MEQNMRLPALVTHSPQRGMYYKGIANTIGIRVNVLTPASKP